MTRSLEAGYGQALPPRTLPLHELTVTYDPKARFSALTFPVSAVLRARLDAFLPPRTSATIYACLANPEKQNTSVYAVERDGGMGECIVEFSTRDTTDLDRYSDALRGRMG